MKRIIMILIAAFLMGGMAMAQHARRGDKMPDPKVRAERMTERMTKEYSLNDKQKKQLLEANMALVEKTGDMPMARTAYTVQLQKIMTKDQYAAYTKNMQEKKAKKDSKRKRIKQV